MTPVLPLAQLPAGHMHAVTVGDYDVLLANVDGTVYAVENKCSHYQFALSKGALCEHRVRCPLHHACFDVRNGEQLEAPGMEGLPTFAVAIEEGQICVSETPQSTNRPEPPEALPESRPRGDHYDHVIVGAGTAAAYAVEAIRDLDQQASILMLGQEEVLPYDRTAVTKNFLQEDDPIEKLPLRSVDFYRKLGVDFRAGARVQRLDLNAKSVLLEDGAVIHYDHVLMATGGTPRKLSVPGADLPGVYTIRQPGDAVKLREAVHSHTRVVIVGGSFIGLESAMSLGKRGGQVTVVSPGEVLFGEVFGEAVGRYVQDLHEAAGVTFKLGRTVTSIQGAGRVEQVVLDDGSSLPADVVVVGIGVRPATDYVSGIAFQKDHSIKVDGHLAAHGANAWAAGDIATYPDREGEVRIEHWKVASQQGRIAGRNMAGSSEAYHMVPFFWTNQQGVNFRYVGHGTHYDRIVLDGKPGETPFLAFYIRDRHVQACLGVKRDAEAAAINELMALGRMPPVDQLVGQDWLQLCREV
ncbi:NADPH-dependent 2,4-dienoyl-CoA reductase/sulfur reductase-like enzyme/nitrite reductase/ring-hydroxylating ferredoxin subunit [Lewinella marina]|uniref:Rieske domain-containing protein n=1 Tax=Neolewinella marina TaxID=438751 RepID=A0A2G0CFI4_9BACT|nr:FAD-dependent oxidoreductase [Neolewinella marina]NJB85635.1 NADPH-dependent 2,4-dienoyl-CoA reductase/sulfur reductase-like enzyme/nitrite reductase/ring-hydroxylating ferredoxin subunit [Neolewinella marina]PHK98680.1 hypothetical protein CGL56_09445 [Neolewinella marina]